VIPGSAEWHARVAELLAEESREPMRWWYLSFADDVFLGAAVVEARGMTGAVMRAHALGINPGGQVAFCEVPPGCEDNLPHDRLLSKAELGPAVRLGDFTD
jgi:hypothetical protein